MSTITEAEAFQWTHSEDWEIGRTIRRDGHLWRVEKKEPNGVEYVYHLVRVRKEHA